MSEESSETYAPGTEAIPPATALEKQYDAGKGTWVRRLIQRAVLEDDFTYPPGRGVIRIVTGADPAAGQEISETVPSGKIWKLRSIVFVLATSSTAATRRVILDFDDGTNVFSTTVPNATQAASLTYYYKFALGLPLESSQVSTGSVVQAALPDILLLPGYRFKTTTVNKQSGDDYSAVYYEVEEFDAPPWTGVGDAGGSILFGGGSLSVKTHTDVNDAYAAYQKHGLTPSLKEKIECDVQFKSATDNKRIDFDIIFYDGANLHEAYLLYDPVNSKWQYKNSAGSLVDISGGSQSLAAGANHHLVITVDFYNDKYGYILCDNKKFDLRTISLYTAASATKVSAVFQYGTATATATVSAEAYLKKLKIVEVATA